MRQGNGGGEEEAEEAEAEEEEEEEEEEKMKKKKKKKKNTFGTAFTRPPQAVIYHILYIYQYTFTAPTSSLMFWSISATADDRAE